MANIYGNVSAASSNKDLFRRGTLSRRSQRPINNKLETFLKRNLPPGEYLKVRYTVYTLIIKKTSYLVKLIHIQFIFS